MTTVTVYGDATLHIISLLPQGKAAAEEMLFTSIDLTVGGSAGMVCWQMAELGEPPQFIGVVGDDWPGQFIKTDLNRRQVNCAQLQLCPGTTTKVLILLQPDGTRRVSVDIGVSWADVPWPRGALPLPASSDALAYVCGFPGYEPTIQALHAQGVRLLADLGFMPYLSDPSAMRQHALALAPYLEIMVLSGANFTPEFNRQMAQACLDAGTAVVLTTLGPAGVLVSTPETAVLQPAVPNVQVVNSLCAGDAFIAGFLAAQTQGRSLLDSVQYGQAVSAAKLTLFSQLPSAADVAAMMEPA